jgi:hypothetical protein
MASKRSRLSRNAVSETGSGKVLTDGENFSQGELANYQSICNHYCIVR